MVKLYRITTDAESGKTKSSSTLKRVSAIQYREGTEAVVTIPGEILETAATDISLENRINAQRMARFKAEFSSRLIQLLHEQDFEYGVDTPADDLVRNCLTQNESVAKQWLNQLFVENYNDETVIVGILRVLSHFEYHIVAPQGTTMALAALANSKAEVRECGIRAFENWATLESLHVLENVKCQENWLNEYLQQVIADLKEELGVDVVTR